DAGLKLFTHLGNGCPGQLHRHDNIVQRVLSMSDQLKISFIADGHHVPVFALKNYLRCVPRDNVIIVTDAISAAGLGPGRYELSDQVVEVDPDGAAWSACRTHFAGCATTMPEMVRILRERLAASEAEIPAWTSENAANLLGG
ncbi:MAG: N-acetylglucosamine-6-phosphate deacetylase, partial [Pirellulales bacterium]|nr:N-acetylglucosamine-6-phosphate deacetylase [Pirellulales bacterium]